MNVKITVISLFIITVGCINASDNTPTTSPSKISQEEFINDLDQLIKLKEIVAQSNEHVFFENIQAQQNECTEELQKELAKCVHLKNCLTSQTLREAFINFNQAELATTQAWENLQNSEAQQKITVIQKKYQ